MTPTTLRPVTDADADFLVRVFAGTREALLAALPLDARGKDAFVRQQLAAQTASFRARHPNASYWVVVDREGTPIGRLVVDERDGEIDIVDVALVPEARGRGIGEALVRDVIARARERQVAVRLEVASDNPARHLYERLGFVSVGTSDGMYQEMELQP